MEAITQDKLNDMIAKAVADKLAKYVEEQADKAIANILNPIKPVEDNKHPLIELIKTEPVIPMVDNKLPMIESVKVEPAVNKAVVDNIYYREGNKLIFLPNIEEDIKAMLLNGASNKELADKYKVSPTMIYQIRQKHNIASRSIILHDLKVDVHSDIYTRRLALFKEGKTMDEVAAIEGVHSDGMAIWLRHNNLPQYIYNVYDDISMRRTKMIEDGLSYEEIAKREDTAVQNIRSWAHLHNISCRDIAHKKRLALYKEGKTFEEIAKLTNTHMATIYFWARGCKLKNNRWKRNVIPLSNATLSEVSAFNKVNGMDLSVKGLPDVKIIAKSPDDIKRVESLKDSVFQSDKYTAEQVKKSEEDAKLAKMHDIGIIETPREKIVRPTESYGRKD